MKMDNATVINQAIDVDRDVQTVYNQWTQFEDFPRFMDGVEEVRQLTDTRLRWKTKVGPAERQWEAEIDEQIPDRIISWRGDGDVKNAGKVTFQPLGPDRTRVDVTMAYDKEGFLEQVGDAFGVPDRRVAGDLERFKEFIESRPAATGAYRESH